MTTTRMQKTFPLASLILALVALCTPPAPSAESGMLEFLRSRKDRQYQRVPRQVLAFYYSWYGRPERHGRWVHWGKVDPKRHDISESTHYPEKGAYDSHDPAIVDWHIDLARQNGLTGFIATWWGQRTFDDRAFELLIQRAAQKDFKVTIYWETAPGKGQAQIRRAVDDLLYVLRKYGSQDAFLKVDGKPVIFVYGRVMEQVPLNAWPEIIRRAHDQYGGDFLLMADGYTESYARLFDGVHTYNICGWVRDKSPSQLETLSRKSFQDAVDLASRHGKISCLTVIPGYDDRKIRKPGLFADRQDGRTYEVLWDEAIRADPDWVLITSWNEWHEGSEIEPSWEDGDKYIRWTGRYAARFRATAHRRDQAPAKRTGPSAEVASELQDLYRGKRIGVLPDFGSDVVFWLADAGLALEELEWPDLLDPAVFNARDIPLTLYASGENYVGTVSTSGDVIKALQRYLREGGLLVAMPFLPYPFFYDQTGRPNIAAGRVGFPIYNSGPRRPDVPPEPLVQSWESPPSGRRLTFYVDVERLPGLAPRVGFPATGDQRWRPATASLLDQQDIYVPLATLKDERGQSYGDAVAFVHHKTGPLAGGKTLYVWMRVPDVLGQDATFSALFRFGAGQL